MTTFWLVWCLKRYVCTVQVEFLYRSFQNPCLTLASEICLPAALQRDFLPLSFSTTTLSPDLLSMHKQATLQPHRWALAPAVLSARKAIPPHSHVACICLYFGFCLNIALLESSSLSTPLKITALEPYIQLIRNNDKINKTNSSSLPFLPYITIFLPLPDIFVCMYVCIYLLSSSPTVYGGTFALFTVPGI